MAKATENTLPAGFEGGQEVKANWFKFEKVGDAIKGTLLNKTFKKSSDPMYKDQWVYEIKKEDGSIVNVGISVAKDGTVQRMNQCQVGEVVGLWFEKEIPPAKPGRKAAKSIKVMSFGTDPDYVMPGEETPAEDVM